MIHKTLKWIERKFPKTEGLCQIYYGNESERKAIVDMIWGNEIPLNKAPSGYTLTLGEQGLFNWLKDKPLRKWEGVECNLLGYVIKLDMGNVRVHDIRFLSEFKHLRYFKSKPTNTFSGTIPDLSKAKWRE